MHKILIVDDERPARDYIAELVTSYLPDSRVVNAENPDMALACIAAENFDLLFVDIEMPPPYMNGMELLEEINRQGKFPFTVIISAHRKWDYSIRGYELGVVRYIPKPLPESPDESEPDTDTVFCISKPVYGERIFEAIQTYLSKVKHETIDLKVYNGILRMEISQIQAIETEHRGKVNIYTPDTLLKEVFEPLNQLYNRLPSHFLYIRRNCIINLHAVKRCALKSREVFVEYQKREYPFTVSRENMKKLAAMLYPENIVKNDA